MITSVLIAEDFESTTISVRKTLDDFRIEEVRFVYYCDDAVTQLKKSAYDLLITDLSFDEEADRPQQVKDGEALISAARALHPALKIIVFSGTAKPFEIVRLYEQLQIDAYVPKGRRDAQKLKEAIEAIQKGKRYYPPDVRQMMRQQTGHDFTVYDITILSQILKGKTQKQVADHLHQHQISPSSLRSIEQRLKEIRDSYGFLKNEQLIAYCKDQGII
ncbi:response regulator [Mucilaginibacter sp. CAU 1740]|uniref:response regulator n=1 Tax=Mucilaginibacter sp. CAU 1740 TaxID=3140365 RepID=UPI00325B9439